jgi:hypothetical protein
MGPIFEHQASCSIEGLNAVLRTGFGQRNKIQADFGPDVKDTPRRTLGKYLQEFVHLEE